jgi:acetyltransferase-like isoleucine patch superfamily enzyme
LENQEFPQVSIRTQRPSIGAGVRIGAGTVIVADELHVGDGAEIGADCDLRAARIVIGAHARIGEGTRVLAADGFSVGDASVLEAGGRVTCLQMTVGSSTYLGARLQVGLGASMEERSIVMIGSRCQIAPDVGINPTEPVQIGDDVGISPRVALWTHGYHSGHPAAGGFAGTFAGIRIEDGVWLGYDVAVLPGVTIGAHSQVAARAVVTRSLPARVLAAGVPAVVKRELADRSLDAAERAGLVQVLVTAWLSRLAFKGLQVEPDGTSRWRVNDTTGAQEWSILRRPDAADAGTLELLARGSTTPMVFCFDAVSISGRLDRLGHDLRDFCRRQSWFFDYDRNSVGLMPARFARLMEPPPPPPVGDGRVTAADQR